VLPPPEKLHPKIRAVIDYWRSIHPAGGGLPGLTQVNPLDIPSLLEDIWILDVRRDPYRFTVRLIGEKTRRSGAPFHKGFDFDALGDGKVRDNLLAVLKKVAETHEPDWYRGPPNVSHTVELHELERVILPLASDGKTVDAILILSFFYPL
jgi:hypothetical protein